MSAGAGLQLAFIKGSMTVAEARSLLEEAPVFGDKHCIEAHKLLLLAGDLCEARGRAHAKLTPWEVPRLRAIDYMTAEELHSELERLS